MIRLRLVLCLGAGILIGFCWARWLYVPRQETALGVDGESNSQPAANDRRWTLREIRSVRDDLDGSRIKVHGALYRDKGGDYWLVDVRTDVNSFFNGDEWQKSYGLRLPDWKYRESGNPVWFSECTLEGKFATLDLNEESPADLLSPLFSVAWDEE
ncbi:MAG: hypothetical protein EOP84_10340 [Verrucomicrobiaceae bacterium]|nr:MAG: hypothetical protein EOP84_10340 [Verrucomicrobiaceae bacterium]